MDSLIIDIYEDSNTYENIMNFLYSDYVDDKQKSVTKEIKRIKRIKDSKRRVQTLTDFLKKLKGEE